jgi:pyruvate formate lyase activating enzyme
MSCPYCKRGIQFIGQRIQHLAIDEVLDQCDKAVKRGMVIRLSGGDPATTPTFSLMIAKRYKKISMAHNGSSPQFCQIMAPHLSSAAIDLKACPWDMSRRTGRSSRMFYRAIDSINILSERKVLVDIRTPIFGDVLIEDMLFLAQQIVRHQTTRKFWTWRLYKPVQGCSFTEPNIDSVIRMICQVKDIFPDLKIGLRAKWEPEGFLYF